MFFNFSILYFPILISIETLIAFCTLWICLLFFYYEIKIGEPPIKGFLFGYKYSYLRRSSTIAFKKLYKLYPNYKLIKICYSGPQSEHLEYADGIVVSETDLVPDAFMLNHLFINGLSFSKIPSITHAISVWYPIIPWFPLTKWVAVAVAYPRLYKYVKKHNLCAYPAVEMYDTLSVTIMVPLHRQDEFVVREAERLVNGRMYSAMLSPIYFKPQYLPLMKKSTSSVRSTKGERKG